MGRFLIIFAAGILCVLAQYMMRNKSQPPGGGLQGFLVGDAGGRGGSRP